MGYSKKISAVLASAILLQQAALAAAALRPVRANQGGRGPDPVPAVMTRQQGNAAKANLGKNLAVPSSPASAESPVPRNDTKALGGIAKEIHPKGANLAALSAAASEEPGEKREKEIERIFTGGAKSSEPAETPEAPQAPKERAGVSEKLSEAARQAFRESEARLRGEILILKVRRVGKNNPRLKQKKFELGLLQSSWRGHRRMIELNKSASTNLKEPAREVPGEAVGSDR